MTVTSVMAAAATQLASSVPSLVTIIDIERAQAVITPNLAPLLLMQDVNQRERPIAYGLDEIEWDLDNHVWAYYATLSASDTTFRALVDAIAAVYRAAGRFAGLADTATTKLLFQGKEITTLMTPWQEVDNQVCRHAVITSHIREIVDA